MKFALLATLGLASLSLGATAFAGLNDLSVEPSNLAIVEEANNGSLVSNDDAPTQPRFVYVAAHDSIGSSSLLSLPIVN